MRWMIRALAIVALACSLEAVSFIAFEQVTVAGTSIGFTSTKVEPDGSGGSRQADTAVCRLRTAEISYTIDGTTPTAAVGALLEPGDVLTVSGHDSIMRFRAIRTGGTSGQLDCVYSQK
jgi:hypothetical protein